MTTEKIITVVEMYRKEFEKRGIPKKQMNPKRTFGSLSSGERLEHTHYLLDLIIEHIQRRSDEDKVNRLLASAQTLMSISDWYTLEDLMNHNRP